MDGGRLGEDPPDLDLDRPTAGDTRVVALFRDGLRPPRDSAPDLWAIERRARRWHRRRQAVVTGVVTAAAAAAVTLVASPWMAQRGGHAVPAQPIHSTQPSPTVTVPVTVPRLTKASLLRPADLALPADNGGPHLGGETFGRDGSAQDVSGNKFTLAGCYEPTVLEGDRPTVAWKQSYLSQTTAEVPAWEVTETIVQWPGRPDRAFALRDWLRDRATPGFCAEKEGVLTVTRSGAAVSLPTLETKGATSEGLILARDFVVVGDALIILEVASAAGDLSDQTSVNALSWLFPATTRVTGGVPRTGEPGPLRVVSEPGSTESGTEE